VRDDPGWSGWSARTHDASARMLEVHALLVDMRTEPAGMNGLRVSDTAHAHACHMPLSHACLCVSVALSHHLRAGGEYRRLHLRTFQLHALLVHLAQQLVAQTPACSVIASSLQDGCSGRVAGLPRLLPSLQDCPRPMELVTTKGRRLGRWGTVGPALPLRFVEVSLVAIPHYHGRQVGNLKPVRRCVLRSHL
jgi:hypothetical protein